MMLRNILIFVILLSNFFSFSQEKKITKEYLEHINLDVFYDITLQDNDGPFGYTKIQLQREGILCKTHKDRWYHHHKEIIKFIPMSKLNYYIVLEIYNYVFNNNFMN